MRLTDMAILSRSGGGYEVLCLSFLIVCHSPLSRTPTHSTTHSSITIIQYIYSNIHTPSHRYVLSRADVARMRQAWLSSPDQGGDMSNINIVFFSLCVTLRSHVRPLTQQLIHPSQ